MKSATSRGFEARPRAASHLNHRARPGGFRMNATTRWLRCGAQRSLETVHLPEKGVGI